ncbi:MAG: protein kinase [Deltaproteobacteria bacterium]|nr:protein kinase [Deltaproteobacteria bacterium]
MIVFADDSLGPGVTVDKKYRLVKLLGTGGMGEVHEAVNVAINRRVAIKLLHPALNRDERSVGRLQNEARVAGGIDHENICDVFDLGVGEGGRPYLVMPLLKGYPLGHLLKDRNIATARLLDIICQTLSALQAAHDHGVVHRDLKPDNIFITKNSDRDDFVKLLDFGICKVVDSDFDSDLTRSGTVVGTPTYMSPEQARGGRHIDHRADIYAVGVIMYRALTGRLPFEGESYNEVIIKITTEQFPSPQSLRPSISSELEKIVLRAMSRDPAERYAGAQQMQREIETISGTNKRDESDTTAMDSAWDPQTEEPGDITPTAADTRCDASETTSTVPRLGRRQATVLLVGGAALALTLTWLVMETREDEQLPPSVTKGKPIHEIVEDTPSVPLIAPRLQQDNPSIQQVSGKAETVTPSVTEEKLEQPASPKPVPRPRSARNKKKPRRNESSPPSSKAAEQKKQQGVISGRFGTVVYSEYEE